MNATAKRTSPAAIARIIKRELGMPTVPAKWEGLHVTKGAVPGTVWVEADFDIEGRAVRRITAIADMLRGRGYDVNVTATGTACSVYPL